MLIHTPPGWRSQESPLRHATPPPLRRYYQLEDGTYQVYASVSPPLRHAMSVKSGGAAAAYAAVVMARYKMLLLRP